MRDNYMILLFPIVLTIGILLIPVVTDYADHDLAAAAVDQTFRWVAGHLISAAAFGLGILSCSMIRTELHRRSYDVPSFTLIFIASGAGLYAAGLGINGIGPMIMKSAGASPIAFFDASGWWVTGIFITATGLFGVGLISLIVHAIRGGLVHGNWRPVVFISSLVFVAAPAILSGWALYGVAAASIGIFVPIGISMNRYHLSTE